MSLHEQGQAKQYDSPALEHRQVHSLKSRVQYTTILVTIAALVTGFVFGAQFQPVLVVRQFAGVGIAFLIGVVVALTLGGLIAFVLRQVWKHEVISPVSELWKELRANPSQARTPQYWLEQALPRLIPTARAFAAKLVFASALGALVAVVTNLILLATLMVNQLQADRLADQNRLLQTSNAVTLLQARTDSELNLAGRKFDEINRILSESRSISEQVYAIEQIPHAMTMSVRRLAVDGQGQPVDKDEDGNLDVRNEYPNLASLRARLIAYIREDRIQTVLRNGAEAPSSGRGPSAHIEELAPLEPVSTAILVCLHRLGYGGAPEAERQCVWSLADAKTGTHEESITTCLDLSQVLVEGPPTDPLPKTIMESGAPRSYLDLRHITDELRYAQLPYAMASLTQVSCRFRDGVDLRDVHLQRANLHGAELRHAVLHRAKLQGSRFSSADLREAELTWACLEGADFGKSRARGALFGGAQLQCAHFNESEIQGASFDGAGLEGAEFLKTNAQGASFQKAVLTGAFFRDAQLQGASLVDALLVGANLFRVGFQGADLRRAQLHGASFDTCHFESADLSSARFGPLACVVTRRVCPTTRGTRTYYSCLPAADGDLSDIPASRIDACVIGHAFYQFKLDESSSQSVWAQWAVRPPALSRIRWSLRDDALRQLRESFKVQAESLVGYAPEMPGPVVFGTRWGESAKDDLFGVYVDALTINGAGDSEMLPPPADAFARSISNQPNRLGIQWDATAYRARAGWRIGSQWPVATQPTTVPSP